MSKSYEPQIKWRVNEVEELVASMKERELLTISDGKKRRSLEVFAVVRSDLQRKGIFRTEEQIRKKMNELRKQYFEANRSEPENRNERCEHYDALHDLFTDAQRKLDKRTERSRTRSKRRHSQNGSDVLTSVQSNISKSNRRSVSGSSVCSSAHSSKHNGHEQNHHPPQPQQQQHQQQNGGEAMHNGGRRNHSPGRMVPDKFHLKQCAYQPNLNNSLTNLCKNDRYADVMLLVCNDDDSIAIPAHRLVLGTFSPYFANVFEKFTFVPSSPIIYVALPPTVTRAAMQCLLQYMYTGEAIVHSQTLDDVMMCGEFLRINGFSAKKANSMLKNQQGLVSVPLVTVTKTINMDTSLQNDARRDSSTPVPATITTRASPPTPVPVPMTMRPYYDSQSPPRKMARHYEPLQQQTLFQPPEYSLTHQSKREMQHLQQPMQQHNLQRAMYVQEELLDQQLMQQQAQRSQMLPQRQAQFAHQRQLQQYHQPQQMSDDLFQPMPTLRQQQHLMMQPLQPTMLQQRQVQQRYHPQQLQPLDMDMAQDLLQPPLQTMLMQRQRQQQMMPTQQRSLHSLQSQSQLQDDMFGPQSLPVTRQVQPLQQFVQTPQSQQQQGQLKQQSMSLLQQPQRQMVQIPQSSSIQQRQRMQSQPLQNDYQSEQQLQDDLQESEPLLEPPQELVEPLPPRQRQPTTQLQQSQQPLQQRLSQQRASQPQVRKSQHQLQEDELPERQALLESQELPEPRKSPQQSQRTLQQPQLQDELMEPQELLETQELLAPQKARQIQPQRQPLQLQRMLQQRVTQQQKMQDEVIKPQELLESQELLEPQKPRQERAPQQPEQKQQQIPRPKQQQPPQQQQQLQPKQPNQERQLQQQKTQVKETVHKNVCEPEPVAKSSKDGAPRPMQNDLTPTNDDDAPEEAKVSTKEGESENQTDKSLDDSVHTRSDSEIEFLEKPRKNSIFEEFPDHRKFEDHEQRKKDFIKEYEEHMKNSHHPLVETPESSPSVPPVSPKSPVVARYRSKSPLPSTVTMQQRKPCTQRRAPSPRSDIIEALDSMVTLTSDESMMEIITKSPESQTSHFSTRSHSPDSQAKINALIEHMGMPDTDTAIFVNSSMDSQTCGELDDDSNDHQEGTPLDQLVSSRLNCQLCYESFTTPPEWVQHVSGHCIVDQGLLKRRRISNDDDSDNDSDYFRCDMCASYFILAQDWQNHVANHEAEAHDDV